MKCSAHPTRARLDSFFPQRLLGALALCAAVASCGETQDSGAQPLTGSPQPTNPETSAAPPASDPGSEMPTGSADPPSEGPVAPDNTVDPVPSAPPDPTMDPPDNDVPMDAGTPPALPEEAGPGVPPDPPEPPKPAGPTEAELLTGKWTTLNANGSPTKRHECGFGEVGGKMYLVGGRGNKNTDIFDPATNSWTVGARPPIELHHFQPVKYEGKLYITGALTGAFPREPPAPDFHVYDPNTNKWSKDARLPAGRERGSTGAVVYKNKFYIVSGIKDGHWNGWVPWFDSYDPSTKTWETLPDAPRARDHVAVAVSGDKLYVAGGRNSSWHDGKKFDLTIAPVDMFDFATNQWTTLPNALPTPRAGNSTAILGNHLLIIGGERGNGNGGAEAVDKVEAMDLTSHEWVTLPSLTRNRHATSVVLLDGKLYTAAGSGGGGGGPELNTIERWMLPL